MMFGKVIPSEESIRYAGNGTTRLSVNNVCVEDYRLKIQNVTLELKAGETIGLAGMEGSGQDLFLRSVAGLIRTVNGRIVLNDKDLTGRSYHHYKKSGTAFVPAARLEEGLAGGLNFMEHCVLAGHPEGFFVDWEAGRELADSKIKEFNIRGKPTSQIDELSGGNQQRALLALVQSPLKVLLLEHPTRGLDIESAIYIWSKLKERCKQGTSILFISSDLEEILQYSDRVMVFFSGQVTGPLPVEEMTSEILGQIIGGKGWPESKPGLSQ
jgi:simple sugar transport system ATP-binding protein